jgi:hypothetical protein
MLLGTVHGSTGLNDLVGMLVVSGIGPRPAPLARPKPSPLGLLPGIEIAYIFNIRPPGRTIRTTIDESGQDPVKENAVSVSVPFHESEPALSIRRISLAGL